MPKWWFRLPRMVRIIMALIVLWEILALISAMVGAVIHPIY